MKLYRIRKSRIDNKGRGLYATRDVKAGTKIINYIGKILTNKRDYGVTLKMKDDNYFRGGKTRKRRRKRRRKPKRKNRRFICLMLY